MSVTVTSWLVLGALLVPCSSVAQGPPGYGGVTTCTGAGVESSIRETEDTIYNAALRAHERVHVEQYSRYPSCAVADSVRFSNVDSLVATEAEAYCAEIAVLVAAGRNSRDYFGRYVLTIMREFGLPTPQHIVPAFRRFCPEVVSP